MNNSLSAAVTYPVDHGEGPQARPGFILNTAGSSSWAYSLNSIAHSTPPVTINSFITSSRPLTPFNAFTGLILRTDQPAICNSPMHLRHTTPYRRTRTDCCTYQHTYLYVTNFLYSFIVNTVLSDAIYRSKHVICHIEIV